MEKKFGLIEKAIRRDRDIELVVSIIFFIAGISFWLYGLANTKWTLLFFVLLGIIFMLLGFWFFCQALHLFRFKGDTVKDILSKDPKKIVWVYQYIVINMPYGFRLFKMTIFYFYLTDRRQFALMVPSRKAEELMIWLQGYLPHATFGYSKEKEKCYMKNTALLLKN